MKAFVFSILSLLFFNSHAQNNSLKAGDTVPDYEFTGMLNYPKATARLSDFKGKILILDFWSEGCISCILSWPKLLQLQEKFKEQIQIVLSNPWNNSERTKQIFNKQKKLKDVDMALPSANGNASLLQLFPVSGLPHVVWITKEGVVKAISSGTSITAENIKALIDGRNADIEVKQSTIKPVYSEPLFFEGNGGVPQWIYGQSVFAKADDRLRRSYNAYADEDRGYFVYCNSPLREMYRVAYRYRNRFNGKDMLDLMPGEIDLRVDDKNRYIQAGKESSANDNVFVYQLLSRQASMQKILKDMQIDLERYVGLSVSWEKQKRQCLVLTAKDTVAIKYKSGKRKRKIYPNIPLQINKITVAEFLEYLEFIDPYYTGSPIIDETGYKGLLGFKEDGLNVNINVSNYKEIDSVISVYGMRLTMQEREIPVLVLSEPGGFKFPLEEQLTAKQLQNKEMRKDEVKLLTAKRDGKWDQYVPQAINYVNTYLLDRDQQLVYAIEFYENDSIKDSAAINEALKWARNMVQRYPDYWNTNHFYAALLHKAGRNAEALKAAHIALEMGKKINNGTEPPDTVNLIKQIE